MTRIKEIVVFLLLAQTAMVAEEVRPFWQRTSPDSAIYIPQGENDRCNQQVNAVLTPKGTFVVVWTMAKAESSADQCVVASRSMDMGKTWSAPMVIDSRSTLEGDDAASYGWPLLSNNGRIYIFYLKNKGQIQVRRDITGIFTFKYSDHDGKTWKPGHAIDMGRGEYSHPSPVAHPNFVTIYSPIITSKNIAIAGYARYKAGPDLHSRAGYEQWETEVYFMRSENILNETDPNKLEVSILPKGPRGLRVRRTETTYWCNEPSLIELSDGRVFVVLRTRSGCGYYAVSADSGTTWTTPQPLCYTNGGEKILNPNAPMITHKMADGTIILLHYINKKYQGTFGRRDPIYLVGRLVIGFPCRHTLRRAIAL